jgi:hypothetical protein
MATATMTDTNIPNIQIVPLEGIIIDETYQRIPTAAKVNRLVTEWSPIAAGFLVLSIREDGTRACVDGGHRLTAMAKLGITAAPCAIYHGLSIKQEAKEFWRINTVRTGMHAMKAYQAMLLGGVPAAIVADHAVRAAGAHILKYIGTASSPQGLTCVTTIMDTIDVFGPELLTESIRALLEIWPLQREATGAPMLAGFADFTDRYRSCNVSRAGLIRKLQRFPIFDVLNWANSIHRAEGGKLPKNISKALWHYYNRNRRTEQLPDRY